MKIRHLLAAALAFVASMPLLTVALAEGTANVRVKNDASFALDCRVLQGNVNYSFNAVPAGSTTDNRAIAANDQDWTLVCKKTGTAPSALTMSPAVKFRAKGGSTFTGACSQAPSGAPVCAVSEDVAAQLRLAGRGATEPDALRRPHRSPTPLRPHPGAAARRFVGPNGAASWRR